MSMEHDSNARLDYAWDWTGWLQEGETIQTATLTVDGGVTADPPVINGGRVTTWVSGGTRGTARLTLHIVTSAGREDDRTLTLYVTSR
jgi:hypothetical protein